MKTAMVIARRHSILIPMNTLQLPGTAGSTSTNYASTPDSVANSITSDIDIRAKASLTDWSVGSISGDTGGQYFLAKMSNQSGDRAFAFANIEGKLQFRASSTGIAVIEAVSTVGHGFSAGTVHWIRTTWRNSDDRTQFFTSTDGSTWTQLGADVTLSLTGIANTVAAVTVGGSDGTPAAFGQLVGNIYYAELRNGIDGPIVQSFNATAVTRLGTRNPSTVSAGGPWTLNGSSWDWTAI